MVSSGAKTADHSRTLTANSSPVTKKPSWYMVCSWALESSTRNALSRSLPSLEILGSEPRVWLHNPKEGDGGCAGALWQMALPGCRVVDGGNCYRSAESPQSRNSPQPRGLCAGLGRFGQHDSLRTAAQTLHIDGHAMRDRIRIPVNAGCLMYKCTATTLARE